MSPILCFFDIYELIRIDPLGKYFIVPNNDNNKDKILRALAIGALSEEGEKLFWKLFNDKRPITISSGELETNLQPFDLVKKRDNIIFKQVYGSIDSVIALKKWDTEHIVSEISITVSYKNLDNYFYTKNRFGYNFVNQGKLDKEGITTIYHELKHVEDFFSLEPTLSVEGAEKRVREGDLRIDSNGKIVEPRKYSVNSRAQLFGELVFNKSEKIDKKTREKQIEGIIDSLILKMQENGIFFTRGNK